MSITEAQRQARRNYLGSSDTPTIMNLSPFKRTATDIFWSKVEDLPDEGGTASMSVGNWLEGPMIEWAAEELGVEVTTDPEDLFHVAQSGPGANVFAANHDSLIKGESKSIEAKFANGEMAQAYGDPGTDQVADHVIVQIQHQMYVGDLEQVYVALAVPSYYGVDRRLYMVPRDDELIEQIVTFGCEWWTEHVLAKQPPQGNAVPPLYVLKVLQRSAGAQIRMDDAAAALADDDERLKEQIKTLKADREDVRAKLIHGLGEAEIGLLPDGRKVTFKAHESRQFDINRLRAEKPEVAAQYTNKKSSRTLYIRKKGT